MTTPDDDADVVAPPPVLLPGGRVEMRVDPARGRHLVAAVDMRAGDEALVARPYACALHDSQRAARCDHTFKRADDGGALLRCARCKHARYLGRDAQAAAWKRGHREECAAIESAAKGGRVPPATARMAARALWRKAREEKEKSDREKKNADDADDADAADARDDAEDVAAAAAMGLGEGYDALRSLTHHWDDTDALPPARKATFAQMAMLTCAYIARVLDPSAAANPKHDPKSPNFVDPLAGGPDPRDVARLLAAFACNVHTIHDDELNPVGMGVYPTAAMMNHACAPTVAQTFGEGTTATFRCVRDVRKGEEIAISYVELLATRAERRAELLNHYRFDIDGDIGAPSPLDDHSRATRTKLPCGAVFVDHGADARYPPWRTDAVDDEHLTAARGGGGVVVVDDQSRRDGDGAAAESETEDESSEDEDDEPPIDYSGGLGGGAAGPGRAARADADADADADAAPRRPRGNGVEVHGWGAWGGADRASTASRVAEASRCLDAATKFLRDESDHDTAEKMLTRAEDLLNGDDDASFGVGFAAAVGDCHVLRVRVRAAALRAAIDARDFPRALTLARSLVKPHELCYPENYPPRGLHLALLAKTEAHVGELAAAATTAREALTALTASHWATSRVAREMERVLNESLAELRQNRDRDRNARGGNGNELRTSEERTPKKGAFVHASDASGGGRSDPKWSDGRWDVIANASSSSDDDDDDDDAVAVATTRRAVVAKPPPVEYPRVAPAVFELPDEDGAEKMDLDPELVEGCRMSRQMSREIDARVKLKDFEFDGNGVPADLAALMRDPEKLEAFKARYESAMKDPETAALVDETMAKLAAKMDET